MRKLGTYSVYKGVELELQLMRDDQFYLLYKGDKCPFPEFKFKSAEVYLLRVEKSDIVNAFFLQTKAKCKSFEFNVDRFENNKYRLSTSDEKTREALDLHVVDRGWYDIEVSPNEIERMWEERKPSGYGFPFPEGLKEIEEIKF